MNTQQMQIHPAIRHINYRFVLDSAGIIIWDGFQMGITYLSFIALLLLVPSELVEQVFLGVADPVLDLVRGDLTRLGLTNETILLGIALIPAAKQLTAVFFDADSPLTKHQLAPMRACMAHGWLVDFDGDQYQLYGPDGQRETLDHLRDLEDFVEELEGDLHE